MIRTGAEYRESIRDGRRVWIDEERVEDVASHPALKPIVDIRARIYDPAHEEAMRDVLARVHPEAVVSISSDVLREYREYERSVTTLVRFLTLAMATCTDSTTCDSPAASCGVMKSPSLSSG